MVEPAACKRGNEMQVNSPLILKGWALSFLSDPILVICCEVVVFFFFKFIFIIILIYLGAVCVVFLFVFFLFFPCVDPGSMYFYLLLLTCEPCSASCSFLLS